MPLRFATNSAARFSSIVSMDWGSISGKPDLEVSNHAVAIGDGSGGLNSASPGAKGRILTSMGASADPAFLEFGIFNVKAYGAVGDGATNDSPAFAAAIAAADAAGCSEVLVPGGGNYLTLSPINLDGTTDFTLRGEGATSSAITYPGATAAISARSSVRCHITGLNLVATEAARVIDFRSNVGNTSSCLVDHCVIQHINIGSVATRIGIDTDNNETVSIRNNSISVAAAIDVQGVSGSGHFVIGGTIADNVFSNQTAVNHIKAPGNAWLIERNEFETGAGPSIAKGSAGTSSSVLLEANWMGDGGVSTFPLVTSNSAVLVSIGNTYATSIGGGGSSTCIKQDNSTGCVYSRGDWLEADIGVDFGTGNFGSVEGNNRDHPPTTLISGTPGATGNAATFFGPTNIIGAVDFFPALANKFQVGHATLDTAIACGQDATHGGFMTYSPSNANFQIGTRGNNNAMYLDALSVNIQTQNSGATTINNGGVAPTGTGAYVRATSPTLVTPALGTPSAIVLTNGTGLPVSTGISGLGTGVATFLATPSSANLRGALTDETGTGAAVFATGPAITNLAVTGSNATANNQNAVSDVSISNNDAGASAAARFRATNGTAEIVFGMRGLNQTPYGALAANTAFMYGATDVEFMSDGGKFVFCTGGNTETARFTTDKGFGVGVTTAPGAGSIAGSGALQTAAPSTKTTGYSHAVTDSSLIFNGAGSITLTLLAAATYPGRELWVKNIAAQTVVSASSNVVPQAGGAAGTAILAATAGKWALLKSNGTNWEIMASN